MSDRYSDRLPPGFRVMLFTKEMSRRSGDWWLTSCGLGEPPDRALAGQSEVKIEAMRRRAIVADAEPSAGTIAVLCP